MMKIEKKDIIINQYQFLEFTKSMSQCYFEKSIDEVRNTNFTAGEMKSMTVDIMNKVSEKRDAELMNSITVMVEKWKSNKTNMWKNTVIDFAKDKKDIRRIDIVTTHDDKMEIIIVVEDTTRECVLDYNDFLFGIREVYDVVEDFMVIDECMIPALCSMYKQVETILKRS